MSSFKELNGPLGTEFHSFYKLGSDTPSHTCVDLSAQSSNRLTSQTQTQIGEPFIAFDPTKRLLGPCRPGQEGEIHSQSAQDHRATMPDQNRRIFSTANANLSEPITIVTKSRNRQQQHNHQQSEFAINPLSKVNLQQQQSQHNHQSELGLTPLSETLLQQLEQQHQSETIVQQHCHSHSRVSRRYSKPQGDTCDPQKESSVDGHLLQRFESSLQNSRGLGRRRSSPDLLVLNSGERSAALAISMDSPLGPSQLSKMVGSKVKVTNPQQEQKPQQTDGGVLTKPDTVNTSVAAPSPGLGLLSKTRMFGTWLGLAVDTSDKVEISKKDLNVFAPTTF